MYYIYNKETKGVIMTAPKTNQNDRIKDIIKYNVTRRYFGDWTPDELNNSYICENPIQLRIGILSIDDICDSLWNEMSYNPVRFGTTNPFEFDGKNSLEKFINTPIAPDNKAFKTLSIIQSYLSRFWKLATEYDKNFKTKKYFKSNCVIITTTISTNLNSKPVPSKTYVMMANLRKSIKQIASQNTSDFGKKTYQQQIIDVVLQRHPNLIRPIKIQNFVAIARQNKKLKEYQMNERNLINAIRDKSFEITDTQSRIDTLTMEFENPGDTSKDKALLQSQTKELEKLEYALVNLQQKMKQFTK